MDGFARRGRLLVLGLLALAFVLPGAATAQEETGSGDPQETLTGVFDVRWGDPRPGSGAEPTTDYVLTDDEGETTELLVDGGDLAPEGGVQALEGERVEVLATVAPGEPVAEVQDIEPTQEEEPAARAAAASVTGSKPAVTIPCRFSDSTGSTPHPKSWYEGLMGNTKPGMDHYWREISYGNINLTGSLVTDWYNLPQTRAYYLNLGTSKMLDQLAQDCTAAADAEVNFPGYTNINLMFNQDLNCCAYGGGATLTRDGQQKSYNVVWMPKFSLEPNQSAGTGQVWLAHEMGHSYGLPHSSGPYQNIYDSDWDPMSDGSRCSPMDATYGCIGVYTISYHMDLLGWMPPERKYTATTGPDQSVTLERLGAPTQNDAHLMAQIPVPGSSTQFYTVEARRFAGYDDQIPGEAVVIHKVDTTPSTDPNKPEARVVDPDNNDNPNDAGARWLPGETFTDAANGISVKVTGSTASGYEILINGQSDPSTDSVAPTGKVVINGGASSTRKATVRLTLSATDNPGGTGVREMRVSNDKRRWSAWGPYATSRSWKLASGRGKKTVYVEFRDGAGNVSSPPASDSIRRR